MTGHQQVQQPQKATKTKSKQRGKPEQQKQQDTPPPQPTINVDELAREKVKEVEKSLDQLTSFKLDAFNSWFSILKQIISAADLHRTNDSQGKENEIQSSKQETGDSIYADYGDDNEQFNAHVDLSEQFATNSVKWTIRVQAFKIVHRLVHLLGNGGNSNTTVGFRLSPILERYLPDLVRLSFVAATSPYDELKMQGFEMFKYLIEKFASVEEKEFPGHSILEQYKTQVLSAVKPAFNLDAPPYITAIASQICSLWTCQGLEREFNDVRRTYQLMLLSIEKLEGQSVNQHSKLYTESELEQERVDILASWAQLYVASLEFDHVPNHCGRLSALTREECLNLNQLVKFQIEDLEDKWWEALKDYALLIMPAPKFIGTSHDNENVYTREVALRLFSTAWPKIVLALSIRLSNKIAAKSPDVTANGLESDTTSAASSDGDSPRKQVTKTKYSKFLCGILMKEFSRCLIVLTKPGSQSQHKGGLILTDSTVQSLKSLHLLLTNPETSTVFVDDLSIAQEFYTTLYALSVLLSRDAMGQRLLLNETLDLLFKKTLDKVSGQSIGIQYAVAKLVSSLMTSMKNIEIACRQQAPLEAELHKNHLVIRRRNLMTLVKTIPKLALKEASLQEALIAVFQEMLRFDPEPGVGLGLADQLRALYPAIGCEEHRTHIIEEIFTDLCKRAEDMLTALLSACSPPSSTDKLRLSHVDTFLASSIDAIAHTRNDSRAYLIERHITSVLRPFMNLIDVKEGLVASEHKQRRGLVDHCMSHVTKVLNTFPDNFKLDSLDDSNEAKLLYGSALKLQQGVKEHIDMKNRRLQESKKQMSAKSTANKPQAAKITLKADFSNFYAKKT